jgi:hypothetical protein
MEMINLGDDAQNEPEINEESEQIKEKRGF